MTEKMLEMIGEQYPLRERDAGEYAWTQVNGMDITVRAFDAEGLGNVSAMHGELPGVMNMDTLIVNPFERDMPLISYDRIRAGGKDTLILELYDTFLGERPEMKELAALKEAYAYMHDYPAAPGWYDSVRCPESVMKTVTHEMTSRLDALKDSFVAEYLRLAGEAPACDRKAKKRAASAYTENLLKNGGYSTDIFLKAKGKAYTQVLFRQFLFGTR